MTIKENSRRGRRTDASLIAEERKRNDSQSEQINQLFDWFKILDEHCGMQSKAIDALKEEMDSQCQSRKKEIKEIGDKLSELQKEIKHNFDVIGFTAQKFFPKEEVMKRFREVGLSTENRMKEIESGLKNFSTRYEANRQSLSF